jgi:hypothetical protein
LVWLETFSSSYSKVDIDFVAGCLVWFGLVWFGLVWFGLVWFGLVWFGLVWFGLVWFGLVWFGCYHKYGRYACSYIPYLPIEIPTAYGHK